MAFMLYFLQKKQLASSFAEKNHSFVGLSNICYTIKHEIIQNGLRRFPSQRAHRKTIVFPVVVSLQLFRKI
ncbi:hypothetical protein, partial [Lentihominibacter sp.]|uniref:hypothetical protein n=1 Tax=Lentihominibacter sp. TaxID=2944216 RepID=UPI002A913954